MNLHLISVTEVTTSVQLRTCNFALLGIAENGNFYSGGKETESLQILVCCKDP